MRRADAPTWRSRGLEQMPAASTPGPHRIRDHPTMSLRRGPQGRERRLAACSALAAAAVALDGLPAVLAGFTSALLLIDSVLPVPGATWSDADDRFRRLVRQRARDTRARRLRRRSPESLDVLDDRTGWAAVAQHRALGVQAIELDSITATTEEFKARTFDRHFRPDGSTAQHWKQLWMAEARGADLPPVSVYRVRGQHIVRDGHHRISVAIARGATTIEAEVVELRRPEPAARAS